MFITTTHNTENIDFFYESAPNLHSVKTEPTSSQPVNQSTVVIANEPVNIDLLPIIDPMVVNHLSLRI